YQISPSGQNTWAETSALWDTTAYSDGLYDLRVMATDNAGNSATSAPLTGVRVDNTAPSVTVTNPGALLTGTVTLGSTSSDAGSGIAGIQYQYSQTGQDQWQTTSGSFDTTAVADGVFDLHAVATDNAGNSTTSTTLAGIRIDNTSPETLDNAPSGPQSADVTVTLTPTDAGAGVATTQFKLDSGDFQIGTSVVVPAPADHSNDGVHTISFNSTDRASNVEVLKTA